MVRAVAFLLEQFRDGGFVRANSFCGRFSFCEHERSEHVIVRTIRHSAGQQRESRRRADGSGDIPVSEPQTLRSQRVEEPCGSRSMSNVLSPRPAKYAARLIASVVLPEPPLGFRTTMRCICLLLCLSECGSDVRQSKD